MAAVLLAGVLAACGTSAPAVAPSTTRTIVDSAGATVTVPTSVGRVADAWPAHNEVVAMLGAGRTMVGTVLTQKQLPWLYEVNPQLKAAPTVFTNSTADVEALLAQRPDVVFLPQNSKVADALKGVSVPAVQLTFTDYEGLKKVVSLTGDILGEDAPARAKDYNSYLDRNLRTVTDATTAVPDSARPKVLHVTSFDPLIVDGTDTIIDAWIKAGGGRNAATVKGNGVQVGIEQVLSWNPDVVILGSTTLTDPKDPQSAVRTLLANPGWAGVNAIRNSTVIVNPVGAFYWDRYSAEGALQLLWVAKTLHPELFPALDLVTETKAFYTRFFGYSLTDAQARAILDARGP